MGSGLGLHCQAHKHVLALTRVTLSGPLGGAHRLEAVSGWPG